MFYRCQLLLPQAISFLVIVAKARHSNFSDPRPFDAARGLSKFLCNPNLVAGIYVNADCGLVVQIQGSGFMMLRVSSDGSALTIVNID
jgi:hypothetical protein